MQTFDQIESRARHIKIVGRDDQTLVEDGAVTTDFISIPNSRGLQIKVLENKSGGGEAKIEVSSAHDRRMHKLSWGSEPKSRIIRMKTNWSYGNEEHPAKPLIRAV